MSLWNGTWANWVFSVPSESALPIYSMSLKSCVLTCSLGDTSVLMPENWGSGPSPLHQWEQGPRGGVENTQVSAGWNPVPCLSGAHRGQAQPWEPWRLEPPQSG